MPPAPHSPATTRRRPRAGALLALAVLVALAATGCGNDPGAAAPRPSATASGSTGASSTPPRVTASEVRLARVGGVTGFSDVLVVAPDGHVTGSTRSGAVDCTVPPATVRVLATGAPPTTGLNDGNDRIAASVERDGTTIDLGEAAGADPLSTTARELLDEVQLPPAQRTLCR